METKGWNIVVTVSALSSMKERAHALCEPLGRGFPMFGKFHMFFDLLKAYRFSARQNLAEFRRDPGSLFENGSEINPWCRVNHGLGQSRNFVGSRASRQDTRQPGAVSGTEPEQLHVEFPLAPRREENS